MNGYKPPTGPECRDLIAALGLTQAKAAELTDTAHRTMQYYAASDSDRLMPFAVLYTLLNRADGITINPNNWRRKLPRRLRV